MVAISFSLSIYPSIRVSLSRPPALSVNASARLRRPYWSPRLRAVCLSFLRDRLGSPDVDVEIIIRLLRDDYPTVRGCNTRNKRAVSRCGGSDDKPNKSSVHLAPHGETHVRTSVLRKRERCLANRHRRRYPRFVRISSESVPQRFFRRLALCEWKMVHKSETRAEDEKSELSRNISRQIAMEIREIFEGTIYKNLPR